MHRDVGPLVASLPRGADGAEKTGKAQEAVGSKAGDEDADYLRG